MSSKQSISQTGPPSVEPVLAAGQKEWMRVDSSDEDTLIGNLAAASRAYFENATNRQLITATWQLKLTDFPSGEIVLPVSPLQSITSITYYDNNDAQQTWSSAEYDVDTAATPGRVRPSFNEDYPSDSRGGIDDIVITFVAGYGDAASDVPDGILTAIKLLGANWFENRESNSPVTMTPVPMALETLIWQYKDGTVQ